MHRHLSNIDWWMTCTAGLVCLISTVKKRRRRSLPWKTGTSSWDITNLKQSIFVFWYLWSDEKNSCRYYPLCFYHRDNSMFLPHPGPQGCSFLYGYDCSRKPSHLEMSIILRLSEYKSVIPSSLEMFSV